MARHAELHIEEKLKAAEAWRDRCLLRDGSIFSDELIWTLPHLDELDRFFIQDPREGAEGSFYDKLEEQLRPATPGAKKLAAEMLWVMLLIPRKLSLEKKREGILRIWSWSGETLPAGHPYLNQVLDGGAASAGTAYFTQRWRELRYFIHVVQAWKRLDQG